MARVALIDSLVSILSLVVFGAIAKFALITIQAFYFKVRRERLDGGWSEIGVLLAAGLLVVGRGFCCFFARSPQIFLVGEEVE